ncbi:MAG: hypothetical protein ABI882_06510, partial [Acidobacteriota bacterium]
EGNDTMLIVDRIGGSLVSGALSLGSMFGILYDDLESGHSFSIPPGTCQLRRSITNAFPHVVPPFEDLVQAGHSGWLKLWLADGGGIIGASINYNSSTTTSGSAFNEGHNLHKLTLTNGSTLVIPVFPPGC